MNYYTWGKTLSEAAGTQYLNSFIGLNERGGITKLNKASLGTARYSMLQSKLFKKKIKDCIVGSLGGVAIAFASYALSTTKGNVSYSKLIITPVMIATVFASLGVKDLLHTGNEDEKAFAKRRRANKAFSVTIGALVGAVAGITLVAASEKFGILGSGASQDEQLFRDITYLGSAIGGAMGKRWEATGKLSKLFFYIKN